MKEGERNKGKEKTRKERTKEREERKEKEWEERKERGEGNNSITLLLAQILSRHPSWWWKRRYLPDFFGPGSVLYSTFKQNQDFREKRPSLQRLAWYLVSYFDEICLGKWCRLDSFYSPGKQYCSHGWARQPVPRILKFQAPSGPEGPGGKLWPGWERPGLTLGASPFVVERTWPLQPSGAWSDRDVLGSTHSMRLFVMQTVPCIL